MQTFDVAGVSVFNLTLEKDNVYFANGILVENCADALAFTFAYPVQKASGPDGAGGVQPAKYRTDNDDPFA